MNIKRVLSIILALFMLLSVLSGCNVKTDTLIAPVGEDGSFRYIIVRDAEASSDVQSVIRDMRAAIKKNFDCDVTLAKDTAFEDSEDFYELIVGEAERASAKEAKQLLLDNRVNSADDFIIKVTGRKIVVLALNDKMIETAAKWFLANFCETPEQWNKLYDGYEFIYAPENEEQGGIINKVNNVDLGRYVVVLPRQISYLVGRQVEYYADFMSKFGYSIKTAEERDSEEQYEIIVGDTTRPASDEVNVEGDNFVIKVVGDKIVIKGGNTLATYRGVLEFLNLVKAADANKQALNWSDGYTVNGKYDANEAGTYTLNFNDEFESATVNANFWGSQRYKNKTTAPSSLGGTQYSTDWKGNCDLPAANGNNLVYQSDGVVHIGTRRYDNDFVGADMSTLYTMLFRYGYVETRAKIANYPAYGGIWCNGVTNTGSAVLKRFGGVANRSAMTEIDILENFSDELSYAANVHHWYNLFKADGVTTSGNGHNSLDGDARYNGNSVNNKKLKYDKVKNGDTLADDFHIYSCYWDGKSIDFAFDGKRFLTYEYDENTMPSVNCGLLYTQIECNMGSASYGATYNRNEHKDYYEAQYDYVKIYQSDALNSQMVYAWPEDVETGTLKFIYPDHDIKGKY